MSVQPLPVQNIVQQIPVSKFEDWADTYLAVLGTQDLRTKLRELLARSSPVVSMPASGAGPLSLAITVIFALVRRVSTIVQLSIDDLLTSFIQLAEAIGETSPVDEAFKSSIWWLQ